METIWGIGIAIILFLQNVGHWMTAPMQFFTFLGQAEFYLLVMPILYWCVDARLGLRVALILFCSGGLNESLKIVFHQPRPYWLTQRVHAFASESNFGFPSGHAQNSVSLWGLLAAKMHRRWAWAAAIVLAFCIGLSRLYLGVHFPTDVLVGWLVGALVLWVFLRWEAPVAHWLSRRAFGQQVLIALVASLIVLALTLLIRLGLGGWQVPDAWIQNALAGSGERPTPLSLEGALTFAGVLFGIGAGAAWMTRMGGFCAGGPVAKRVARYLLGLVGVILIWYGLKSVFPAEADLLGYALRYLRYALVGLWVSVGAPALFVRLRLADKGAPSDPS